MTGVDDAPRAARSFGSRLERRPCPLFQDKTEVGTTHTTGGRSASRKTPDMVEMRSLSMVESILVPELSSPLSSMIKSYGPLVLLFAYELDSGKSLANGLF
jgi:hypothetical protein